MGTDISKKPDKAKLERISRFRWQLRRFLRTGEEVAREIGLTVLQYQLLLHTQGIQDRNWASIGELADRLQAQPHGVVALVTRCEQAGLVRRRENALDRRLVEVHLTAKGMRLLEKMVMRLDRERAGLMALAELLDRENG